MVAQAFPVAKLALMLLKFINRPLADMIRNQAKNSILFRSYVCTPPAHLYNWCEVRTKMWILNLGKPVQVPPLNEAMAIELGANLIGEAIMFMTGASVIVSEYNKSVHKETAKEHAKRMEIVELHNAVKDLFTRKDELGEEIRSITRKIAVLESELENKNK